MQIIDSNYSGRQMKVTIFDGHALERLKELPSESVHVCVTSPPYWGIRAYGTSPQIWGGDAGCVHEWEATSPPRKRSSDDIVDMDSKQATHTASAFDAVGGSMCIHCGAWRGELGSEPSPEMFVAHLCDVFDEVRRVLRKDGVCFVNLMDTYSSGATGIPAKNLCLIPQRFAIEMQRRGWYVRSVFSWIKNNPLPESVRDRFSRSTEDIYIFTKSKKNFFDMDAVRVPLAERSLTRPLFGVSDTMKFQGSYGQPLQGIHKPRDKDSTKGVENPAGRSRRTGDSMFESLDAEIEATRAYLRHLESVKHGGGLWFDRDSEIVGAFVNPKGFSAKKFGFDDIDHYAVYPTKLVKILLDTACPKRVCPTCGAGWVRMTNVDYDVRIGTPKSSQVKAGALHTDGVRGDMRYSHANRITQTISFKPACDCNRVHASGNKCSDCGLEGFEKEALPCFDRATVLDPFMGTGTTCLVAAKLGLHSVGIELNPEYVEIATARIEAEIGLLANLEKTYDVP